MDSKHSFLTTPLAILLGAFVISVAILIHGGVIKINNVTQPVADQPQNQPEAPAAPAAPTSAKVTIADSPTLGDKDAPVTLVEFSDYECPFCKRHFDQVYPELKKNYIDTGKVKLVFRNYPLSFHDPMATYEAMAALCVKDQGGDAAYFRMHDEIFKQTTSNGNGLTKEKVREIAQNLGFNADNMVSCIDSNKYKETVSKDMADGGAAGISGTPSFVVGKSDSSGSVEGQLIVGAQPYTAFQKAIDALLK